MEQSRDRIVLAIECGHCHQLSGVQVHNGALYIVRCGMCGQVFPTAQELVHQYQVSTARLANYEGLDHALREARAVMTTALEHWGHSAGKEVLSQAIRVGSLINPETR